MGGNKVYGPDTCILIPPFINGLFSGMKVERELPLGLSYKKANRKYQSQIYSRGKKLYLGLYTDKMAGHREWQNIKVEDLKVALVEYARLPNNNPFVIERLSSVIGCMKEDIRLGLETKPALFINFGERHD